MRPASRSAASARAAGGPRNAAAALLGDAVTVCHADIPFLCDIGHVHHADRDALREIAEFLAEQVDSVPAALNTLRDVDCALLARRITADRLPVGLMDQTCPPSTVFAAYNEITAPKDIAVFRSGCTSVPSAHTERQLSHLRTCLGRPTGRRPGTDRPRPSARPRQGQPDAIARPIPFVSRRIALLRPSSSMDS